MNQAIAVYPDRFSFDGRGPELARVHWHLNGRSLKAIDYSNFGWGSDGELTDRDSLGRITGTFHIMFTGFQVVMITPEEVIEDDQLPDNFSNLRPAALFDLGKSAWLHTFDQRHLAKCKHYKLLFYDELFDIICEGVEVREGSYPLHDAV
jgi:hypothetical protein